MTLTKKNHIRLIPCKDSLPFNPIERDLFESTVLKLGRFNTKTVYDRIHFKSKVVSRGGHAEIWAENDKFYIKDTQSSSGTFVNNQRLSLPNQTSKPHQLHHGDTVQLGISYYGDRCIKIKVDLLLEEDPLIRSNDLSLMNNDMVEICCFCQYAVAPFQALFVTPCSHVFHLKCCFPIIKHCSGFNCPLCRSYINLNANVEV